MFLYKTRVLLNPDANDASGASPSPEGTDSPDAKPNAEGSSSSDVTPEPTLGDVVSKAFKDSVARESGTVDTTAEDGGEASVPEGEDKTASTSEAVDPAGKKVEDEKKEPAPDEKKVEDTTKPEPLPPFHKHPAFQRVVSERDTAKAEYEKVKPIVEAWQTQAKALSEMGISREEMADAVEIAALLRNDPAKFIEKVVPIVNTVKQQLGLDLPEKSARRVSEIEALVKEGHLDPETGKDMIAEIKENVKLKGETALGQSRQAFAARKTQETFLATTTQALNAWHQSKLKTDPAFQSKYKLVQDRFKALFELKDQSGRPVNPITSTDQAVALVERAYTEVNSELTALQPKPAQRKVLRSNGSSSNGHAGEATDMKSAVRKMLREKHDIDMADE